MIDPKKLKLKIYYKNESIQLKASYSWKGWEKQVRDNFSGPNRHFVKIDEKIYEPDAHVYWAMGDSNIFKKFNGVLAEKHIKQSVIMRWLERSAYIECKQRSVRNFAPTEDVDSELFKHWFYSIVGRQKEQTSFIIGTLAKKGIPVIYALNLYSTKLNREAIYLIRVRY